MGLKKQSSGQELSQEQGKRGSFLVNIIIMVVLVAVLSLFVIEVANNRSELKVGRENLAAMQAEEQRIALENEEYERYSDEDNFDEFIERYARDEMGYADPQERIYNIVPGN